MEKPTEEYYCYVRSMIMAEFPSPPLPVSGSKLEDATTAVLNSHDVISTLMITALKMNDPEFNDIRRRRQEQLEQRYYDDLAAAQTFDDTYAAMAAFTQGYMECYVRHGVVDARVLHLDHVTPALRRQIHSFANATAILTGECDVAAVPRVENSDLSDSGLRVMIAQCAERIQRLVVHGEQAVKVVLTEV